MIYLACSFDFTSAHETISALLDLGLDCNILFDGGRTALMAAAETGRGAVFNTLLLHKINPYASSSGLTILYYACFYNYKDIVIYLRDTNRGKNGLSSILLLKLVAIVNSIIYIITYDSEFFSIRLYIPFLGSGEQG